MNEKDTYTLLTALARQFDQCEKEIAELKDEVERKKWWGNYQEKEVERLETELAEYKKAELAAVGFGKDEVIK